MYTGGLDIEKQQIEDTDNRNFNLDVLGGWFGGYKPKHQSRILPTLGIKNQGSVNSCVPQAASLQKEQDESVALSPGSLGTYLVKKGQMGSAGTSLQAALKAEVEYGIAEESVSPTKNTNFAEFSHSSQLTPIIAENAATHKSKSFWTTSSLDTIIQQIDNGRAGLTGMYWYSGYNGSTNNAILEPRKGEKIFGHSVTSIGYNLDYHGEKVIVFQNSFGQNWGHNGLFYVRFEEYSELINFASYYVLDIERDLASWLSLNANRVILEKNGSKCYMIEGNIKRHINNESTLLLMGYSFAEILHDKEDMLSLIQEGSQMTIADIPPIEVQRFKETLRIMRDVSEMKRIFEPIYPDLFL